MRTLCRRLGRALAYATVLLWLAWTVLTLLFANLSSEPLRQGLAGAYLLWLIAAGFALRPATRRRPVVLGSAALVSLIYLAQQPSNERDWAPEVAIAATAEIHGDELVLNGVRNFHYRSEHDFDERWEQRTYDLATLRTLDLVMSYWGPTAYCHTLLSFGFDDGRQLAASVEVRKQRREQFSTFGGLFKQYELSYIFADEQDVIGLRTTHRDEQVYLYRLRAEPERIRKLLLAYLQFANEIADKAVYYDVLANSCGVNIMHRLDDIGLHHWVGREALLNGSWDQQLHARGTVDQSRPFEQLRALSRINERAVEAAGAPDFSARIRAGLPPAPSTAPDRATTGTPAAQASDG